MLMQNKWDHMLKPAPPRPREASYLWWEQSRLDPKLSNSKYSQHFVLSKILGSSRFEIHSRYINTFLRNDLIVKRWVKTVAGMHKCFVKACIVHVYKCTSEVTGVVSIEYTYGLYLETGFPHC